MKYISIDFSFLSSSFSGLFGSNIKDASPKRSTATTTLSSSSTATSVKHSPTNDQIAPTTTADENLSLERAIHERYEKKIDILNKKFII